jgi:methionine-S-sulfoxide reductase
MDVDIPERTETATFALGCFWAPDSRFGSIDGVVSTYVGYAGGDSNNPTYRNLDGHSETIQITFDPGKLSYQELLGVFWDNHNPTLQAWSRQYRSIIFYHDNEQRELAVASKQSREVALGREILTEIIPFSEFYLAEDYHQKYYLTREEVILQDLRSIYPEIDDFIASTAVARINGYAGGFGDRETLSNELDSLGLSEAGKMALLDIADRGLVSGCAVSESG